jgi:hypothetical protein
MATSAAIVAEPALSQPRALASLPILLCVVASAKLRMECGDDRSARILEDFGRLIAVSERMCEDAEAHPENDAAEYVIDAETEYVEELIGSVFLVLQTRLRRVTEGAKAVDAALVAAGHGRIPEFADDGRIKSIQGPFGMTGKSLVALIWAIANYHKHRDEWTAAVWRERSSTDEHDGWTDGGRKTRKIVQLAGVERTGSGNLRRCLEFLGVHPYSGCAELGGLVQAWALDVEALAQRAVAAAKLAG